MESSIQLEGFCSPTENTRNPNNPMPSQERLREAFNYCPDTGVFTNRYSRSPRSQAGEEAGGLVGGGYIAISVDGTRYLAHRLAWMYYHGVDPDELQVDHMNSDVTDNRISNLRLTDHSGNQRNQQIASNNTSGVCGVCWDTRESKWRVQISVDNKPKSLGLYADFDEAVAARKQAEAQLNYHPNHGLTAEERKEASR